MKNFSLLKNTFLFLPSNIWVIGLISMFINISSVIVFMASPFYMKEAFGITTLALGFFEGIVEFIAWSTRILSGVLSDYIKKRKPILIFAYTLSLASRPLFAFSSMLETFFFARTLDRFSNGIQATPREALVGDLAPKNLKGSSYGLRQSLSVLGSAIGAGFMMYFFSKMIHNYQVLFLIAGIPPLLAILLLKFFVKDIPKNKEQDNLKTKPFSIILTIRELNNSYWRIIFVACIFTLSNYSGAFLLLQAENVGLDKGLIPIVMIAQNLSAMLAAYPIGRISDRIDRRYLLAIGFSMVIISGLFLSFACGLWMLLLGSIFWGFNIGINQSIFMAAIADTTFSEVRGTAFGIYFVLIGIFLLLCNSIMGWIWDQYSPSAAFLTSSVFALFSLFSIPLIKKPCSTT